MGFVSKNLLILFTRYPESGKAKTRLIPALGGEKAATLHKQLTEKTFTLLTACRKKKISDTCVYYHGGNHQQMKKWLGPHDYTLQKGEDLGKRMLHAFQQSMPSYERVVIIGSDCPGLTMDIIDEAFQKLANSEAVIGPASDGGYYLIGLRRLSEELFENIDWGTDKVYSQTINALKKNTLSYANLVELTDIDRPEDFENFNYYSCAK